MCKHLGVYLYISSWTNQIIILKKHIYIHINQINN
jgi:hypothetical protein